MKNLCCILFTALLLSSCQELKFYSPQPPDTTDLDLIPDALMGMFTNSNGDTLRVSTHHFDLTGELSMEGSLSDSILLRSYGNCYVMNTLGDGFWSVALLCPDEEGNFNFSSVNPEDEEVLEKLKAITAVEEVRDEKGDVTEYRINPTQEEFAEMVRAGLFAPELTFTRMSR